MKPFNLEEAKAGKPVCAIDGRPARIICFDRKYGNPKFPIVALILDHNEEIITIHSVTGESNVRSRLDTLMMVDDNKPKESEEIIKYCAIFKSADGTKQYVGIQDTPEQCIYKSDDFAGIGEVRIKPINEKQHHEGYTNLYHIGDKISPGAWVYDTEEEAKTNGKNIPRYITTIKIEWEE